MINYSRTEWYGLGYFFRWRGSAIPRALGPGLLSSFICWLVRVDGYDITDAAELGRVELGHPYVFQLLGIVFGYLVVTRINMSYARYWEGVTMIKQMHSKWADACGQIVAFDRAHSTECDLKTDPFCCHIVRLFSQLSAMATMRLHIVDPGESVLFQDIKGKTPSKAVVDLASRTTKALSRKKVVPDPEAPPRGLSHEKTSTLDGQVDSAMDSVEAVAGKYHDHAGGKKTKTRSEKVDELAAGITKAERAMLLAAPCPVFATAQRIQRSIITRLNSGGMRAPPPIVSRIFQELSNGLLFYNNATKMKEVPVPFPYVQLNTILLNLFCVILCPIAIAAFTEILWLSLVMSFLTVCSFYAVFIRTT